MLLGSDVDLLLDLLCTRLGFCLPPHARFELRSHPPAEPLAFMDAVFIAEGLETEIADRHLYRQVRDCVFLAFQKAQRRETPNGRRPTRRCSRRACRSLRSLWRPQLNAGTLSG